MAASDSLKIYRQAPAWNKAISDAQALAVAEMRTTMSVRDIAGELGLSDKRVYQLLDEAKAVQDDTARLLRVGAVAALMRDAG